jgi:hypothetical protein
MSGDIMKRIHIYAVAIAMALVPAVLGLWGNASFSQNVPVRVPSSVTTTDPMSSPGDGGPHDANDDRVGGRGRDHDRSGPPSATPSGAAVAAGDDRAQHGRRERSELERGEDHGGDRRPAEVGSGHRSGGDDVASVEPGHRSGGDDVTERGTGGQVGGGHGVDNGGDDSGRGSDGRGSDD